MEEQLSRSPGSRRQEHSEGRTSPKPQAAQAQARPVRDRDAGRAPATHGGPGARRRSLQRGVQQGRVGAEHMTGTLHQGSNPRESRPEDAQCAGFSAKLCLSGHAPGASAAGAAEDPQRLRRVQACGCLEDSSCQVTTCHSARMPCSLKHIAS